jgi:Tfp pilus assembly protein PilX
VKVTYRSDERGMAIVTSMFMALMMSALVAAMVHVARTETVSSANYTSMSQARYAAESGVAAAANYLLSSGYEAVAPGTAADGLANYNLTLSPVAFGNAAVVLSSDSGTPSNYPVSGVVTAFQAASSGTLSVGLGTVTYSARARLLGMRSINDGITGDPLTLMTWEITGVGRRSAGLGSGEVEVSAVIDRTTRPVFNYAAFATSNGCGALSFTGSARTRSYDSRTPVAANATPVTTNGDGHVGTNGNLTGGGSADVNGTLSTPMAGVGACTANNVTAATVAGLGTVSEGLIQLPQAVDFPTPDPPDPMPPTSNLTINGNTCPAGFGGICASGAGNTTWTPVNANTPVLMGDVTLTGNSTVYLKAGTYHMNSLSIQGNNKIVVDSSSGGAVKIVLAGQGSVTEVLSVTGSGVANTTWDPTLLRFEYNGTKQIEMDGNGDTAAIIYAPQAQGRFWGNADFFGSVIMRDMEFGGSTTINYDRALQQSYVTSGNPVMTTFTWRTF